MQGKSQAVVGGVKEGWVDNWGVNGGLTGQAIQGAIR